MVVEEKVVPITENPGSVHGPVEGGKTETSEPKEKSIQTEMK